MIISSRQIFALDDKAPIYEKLKELRKKRHFIEEKLSLAEQRLNNAATEKEYDEIKNHISILSKSAADVINEIEALESDKPWRQKQIADIERYGFATPSKHPLQQYNMRFTPYLTQDQFMEFLSKLGLKDKIKGSRPQTIELKPNFWVAVENHIVTTVKYADSYYQGPNTPKFDLGTI